jgi:hypothetical protein
MKEIKKYTDIVRYGKSQTNGVIKEGDYISITEKIDGANASFCVDNDNELGVSCYSRNTPLSEDNTLRGFYGFVKDKINPIKDKLNPNYRYFGEWLVSHKVQYKQEAYNKFYLFSIWDEENRMYLSDDIVKSEADKLGLETVTYFYKGKYISFEHLMSFVGKSDMTLEPNTGEGVVVKNVNYIDNFGNQVFVKLVSEKFAEVQKQKLPKNPNVDVQEIQLVKSVLTKARIDKLIHKLVDEGLLEETYGIEDMGTILRQLGTRVYDDIIKEESDLFKDYEVDSIKRIIGKNTSTVVKEVLKEQGRS